MKQIYFKSAKWNNMSRNIHNRRLDGDKWCGYNLTTQEKNILLMLTSLEFRKEKSVRCPAFKLVERAKVISKSKRLETLLYDEWSYPSEQKN